MPFWIILNTLQAGALLTTATVFGVDARRRRDRMTGWLFLACLGLSLRHTALLLQDTRLLPWEVAERAQAILACGGFAATGMAFWRAFRPYFRFRLPIYALAFLAMTLLRSLFLPFGSPFEKVLQMVILLGYPLMYAITLAALQRAFAARDLTSRRLLGSFLVSALPLAAEIVGKIFFGTRIPLSGFSCMFTAVSLAVSWFWVIHHGYELKIQDLEEQVAAWRSLVPGATWSTQETSPLMESLFGPRWTQDLQERMRGQDGRGYQLHRVPVMTRGEVGWLEASKDAEGGPVPFLKGWRLALGVEGVEQTLQVREWLEAWGAEVEVWGTVPPREGPFPSLIIWGREPSILSVWREYELVRRRCRWVQVGGARAEGPHARLELPLEEAQLRAVLESLLAIR